MEYESEHIADDWYGASREILKVYSDLIVHREYNEEDFNTPSQFSLIMSVMIMFHAGQEKELEMLRKEVDELTEELAKYKYGKQG